MRFGSSIAGPRIVHVVAVKTAQNNQTSTLHSRDCIIKFEQSVPLISRHQLPDAWANMLKAVNHKHSGEGMTDIKFRRMSRQWKRFSLRSAFPPIPAIGKCSDSSLIA